MTQDLKEKVNKAVEKIASCADEFPCVVIIHNIETLAIEYMSQRGLDNLFISIEEVRRMSNQAYYEKHFNTEDAKDYTPKILELLQQKDDRGLVSYFQQVRRSHDHPWDWYMSSTRVLLRDDNGKPVLMVTMALQIDPQHHITTKVSRLLDENNFIKKHYKQFSLLSPREKEVLPLLVLGKTANEIAKIIHVAPATVETHRKNIRKKLKITSSYDLAMYARSFDLI
ncbi:MAG TPA: helix-turn-helix transcriptional regulator [Chryseosolibacter sp.]|nr:helix-turn-helix transcriptional regulator [Chryseosolibacter sp.]